MIENQNQDIQNLKNQYLDLEKKLKNPGKLEVVLLDACQGLIAMADQFQGEHIAGQPEIQQIDRSVRENIRGILNAIEETNLHGPISEARYRAIVESQTELICRLTPDGTLTFFNEAFKQYFTPQAGIIAGDNIFDRVPEGDRGAVEEFLKTLTPQDPVLRLEYSLAMPDGITRWQQWTALASFDPAGQVTEIQAVGHDVTDQKLAEISARQHNRELSALHNATVALLSTLDPEALLSRILDAAISAIPSASKGTIHLIAPDTGQLEMRASVGHNDPRIVRIRVPTSLGYVARSVRERTPLLLHNMAQDARLLEHASEEPGEIKSAMVAPLVLKNRVLGAISLESEMIGAFVENDLRLLVSFAATATAAIHNAHLHSEVQKLAITDALTGLYNRRGFFELGQREVERSRRYRRPLVAIMMDIDHFKFINDFYGHPAGDQVLQTVAKRCGENLRRIDILGRFGGDEFTFLLPETDMFTASNVAERIRHQVANRPIVTESTPINVSVSMGVARATATTPDLDVLISRADAAMYIAKREGRNRVEFG